MRKNHIMWRDHKCVFVLPEACSLLKRRFMKSKLQDIFGLKELQITSYRCFYYITRLTSILTDGEVVWRWISKVNMFSHKKKICGKQASEKQKLLKSLPSWVNQFKKMIYHMFFISENIYLLSVLLWKQYKDVNIPLCENDLHCSLLYS